MLWGSGGILPGATNPSAGIKPHCCQGKYWGGRGQAALGRAGGPILTPTCSWILLLKYFWMSLRLVEEQRARRLSSDWGEDEG